MDENRGKVKTINAGNLILGVSISRHKKGLLISCRIQVELNRILDFQVAENYDLKALIKESHFDKKGKFKGLTFKKGIAGCNKYVRKFLENIPRCQKQ